MVGRALTSLLWGMVADRYGRKPVIVLSIISVLVALNDFFVSQFQLENLVEAFFFRYSPLCSLYCLMLLIQDHFQHSVWAEYKLLDDNYNKISTWIAKWFKWSNKGM